MAPLSGTDIHLGVKGDGFNSWTHTKNEPLLKTSIFWELGGMEKGENDKDVSL